MPTGDGSRDPSKHTTPATEKENSASMAKIAKKQQPQQHLNQIFSRDFSQEQKHPPHVSSKQLAPKKLKFSCGFQAQGKVTPHSPALSPSHF